MTVAKHETYPYIIWSNYEKSATVNESQCITFYCELKFSTQTSTVAIAVDQLNLMPLKLMATD